jgi:hypothetical protein
MPNSSSRVDAADIDRAQAVSIADIASERGFAFDRTGNHAGSCPRCGGKDRFSISVRKGAFICRRCHPKGGGGAIRLLMFLDDVGFRDAVETLIGERHAPVKSVKLADLPAKGSSAYERRQHDKARWLWSQRQPITGSMAEKYLREARQIACPLPPTLGFLPPLKNGHHPALISAFGLCDQVEPVVIAAPRDVAAVHLTLLKPDGSGKADADPSKLMIGRPGSLPVVLAPPNHLLGLAICEGAEDALTAHEATGLGAWAAGSAGRMTALAEVIPDYIEALTIYAHNDKPGQHGTRALAAALRSRDIEITMEGI